MGKKGLIMVVSLLAITSVWSWAASAWQVQTKVASTGGSVKVRNNAAQSGAGSISYANFTTSADVPVTVAANPGYSISGLTRNGSAVALGNFTSHYTTSFNKSTASVQSLIASFATKLMAVTTTVNGQGSISPAGYQVNYNGNLTLTATPTYTNGIITSLTVNGTPYPVTFPYSGALKVNLTNVKGATNVSATFATVTANAGADQMVTKNSTVQMNGSASGGATTWSQLSGPVSVNTSSWLSLTPSFSPSVTGIYVFQLNQSAGGKTLATSSMRVTVIDSVTGYVRTSCNGCHSPSGLVPSNSFRAWSTSKHKGWNVNCVTCHTDGAMPSPVNVSTVNATSFVITGAAAGPVGSIYCLNCHNPAIVTSYNGSLHKLSGVNCITCHAQGIHNTNVAANVCDVCHRDANGNVARHPVDIGASACVTCHDPHSAIGSATGATAAHYNNMTGAGYPASYVTSRATCMNCHFADAGNNATVRHEWAQSKHGAVTDTPWTAYDFKTRAGCVQCHTTTGFIAYSTGKVTAAWGVASDKTKEVLTCVGCHSDIATGAVRTITPVKPFADDSYVNRNVGTSNLCMDCHSGRNNGASIQVLVGSADFTNTPFVAPHYLSGAATLHGKSGFHFPSQTYAFYSSNSHRAIGMGNRVATGSNGPCVACHMSAADKHLYQVVTADANGAVTGIKTTLCANCHVATMDAAKLAADQAAFNGALNVLQAALADKGIVYSANYPYFSVTNWGTGQAGANVMGAAFNYKLLLAEPGAYVHNSGYARKLITDSIDAVYNGGTVTGSIDSAVAHLVALNKISQADADAVTTYSATTNCASCHANNTGSHTGHLSATANAQAINCSDCHNATAANGSTLVTGSTTHIDGQLEVVIAPAHNGSFDKQSNTCSNVYCHSNGRGSFQSPVWGSGKLTCASCHADLAGAHGAHIGDLLSSKTASFYNFTGNYSAGSLYRFGCANCHSFDAASHNNGNVDLSLVPVAKAGTLRFLNSTSAKTSGLGNSGSLIAGSTGVSVTCSAAYCHSNGRPAGKAFASSTPDWYQASGAIAGAASECVSCHGGVVPGFNNLSTGSHFKHVNGAGYAIACVTCHAGTAATNGVIADASKHINGSKDLVFSGTAAGTTFDGASCSVNYCHSKGTSTTTLEAPNTQPVWGATLGCTGCHNGDSASGAPMATGGHSFHLDMGLVCSECHSATASNNLLKAGTTSHVNGSVDLKFSGSANGTYDSSAKTCSSVYCHSDGLGGYATMGWAAGSGSGSHLTCLSCHPVLGGAHAAHIGDLFTSGSVTFYNFTGNYSAGSMYRFGCANCHPVDATNHRNGKVDLILAADPAAGTLRSLNDSAVTVGGLGVAGSGITGTTKTSVTCSATYCHSNGYQFGNLVYAASPDWYNPASYTGDRCAMCHGNSPNSTIVGSAAHTVHTVGIHSLNVFSGSFGNLTTGSVGNVGHGIASQSTTLNCNVCHNDTVSSPRNDANNACIGCHNNQGNAAQIGNKALHVNGRVDVTFANMTVVSKAQLRPASFAAYSGTYWTRNGGNYKNGAAAYDTSKVTLKHAASFDLGSCSNVACHMGKPVQWSDTNSPSYCALCHTAL